MAGRRRGASREDEWPIAPPPTPAQYGGALAALVSAAHRTDDPEELRVIQLEYDQIVHSAHLNGVRPSVLLAHLIQAKPE